MMLAFVERARCPACEGGATSTLYSRNYAHPSVALGLRRRFPALFEHHKAPNRRYEIARCDQCELLFQRFIPCDATLLSLYESQPDTLLPPALPDAERPAGPSPERVLDFGAGDPGFCVMHQACGRRVVAVDFAAPQRARLEAVGIEAYASCETLPVNHFDLVRCHQIIEHLPNPFDTLRELTERLTATGRLELCVPDATGAAATAKRMFWGVPESLLRPLEHLNGFTRSALETLERRLGLIPVRDAPPPWNRRGRGGHLWRALERQGSPRA